jgi:hypothetical protein
MEGKMEKITPYEVLCKATRIKNEGHNSLKAIEAAITFLHEYESHLKGEDAEDVRDIIVGFDYKLRERRAEFEKQTIDEVLAEASEMRKEDSSHYLYWTRSAKEFLEGCEGFFTDEDAKKLSNAIASFSQDIEVAMAKIEKRTVDEVLEEASRIESEGSFSSDAITDAKTFMHLYEGYFTGEDADRLGNAQSSLFQDLEAAMFRELGPGKPMSEEDIREQEEMLERAGIITV